MEDNTNIWDAVVTAFFLTFLLAMFSGTAYLVQVHGWSMWTFLLALVFVPSIKTGINGKKKQ